MNIAVDFRAQIEGLPGGMYISRALQRIVTGVASSWDRQHKDDGTHGAVTADSMRATTVQVGAAVNSPSVLSGMGTPEGSVLAVMGSLYLRTDGGAATSVYVKETGNGATKTGWVAK